MHGVDSAGPFPTAVVAAFESQFFAPGVDALLLCQAEIVRVREILIERHVVVQVLVGRDGRQDKLVSGILCVEAAVQQASAVE